MATNSNHPFNPSNLVIKDYIPNSMTNVGILSIALPGFAVVFIAVWLMTAKDFHGRPIPLGQRAMLAWFGLCGMIHCILEGYFSVFYETIPSKTDFLGQICKFWASNSMEFFSNFNQFFYVIPSRFKLTYRMHQYLKYHFSRDIHQCDCSKVYMVHLL